MQLEDFKAAALRVFYDIVNADGIIDINEVNLLDGLKKKYGITSHNGQENPVLIKNAHSITLGEALTSLAQWKQDEIYNEYADRYSADEVYEDALCLATSDGDCAANEASILLAMQYLLKDNCDEQAKVISCKTRDLKFSKNEIIYIADDDYPEEEQLQDEGTLDYITSKLKLYGFDFIYIPQVVKFLTQTLEETKKQLIDEGSLDYITSKLKLYGFDSVCISQVVKLLTNTSEKTINLGNETNANDSILSKIMMFTHPLLLSNADDIKQFTDSLRTVTTSEFTEYYFGKQGNACADIYSAWLMLKIATSRKISSEVKGHIEFENYNDFLLIPFGENVIGIVNKFLKKYIELANCISKPVVMYSNERVHSKGFHKTILDYVMYKSRTLNKIVLDISSRNVIFDGLGEFFHLPPAEFAMYILIVARNQGVSYSSDDKQQSKEYGEVYKIVKGITENKGLTIGSKISKITACITKSLHIDNKDFYIPHNDKTGNFVVDAPKNLFYIRNDNGYLPIGEPSLKDWYKKRILNK